jgi:hypothetical protein
MRLEADGLHKGRSLIAGEETEIYLALGLPLIDPELREGRGELDLALKGKLPKLVNDQDLRGILHRHTAPSWRTPFWNGRSVSAALPKIDALAARNDRLCRWITKFSPWRVGSSNSQDACHVCSPALQRSSIDAVSPMLSKAAADEKTLARDALAVVGRQKQRHVR